MLVLLGDLMQVSVGDLFMGALIPGLSLGFLYVLYIIILAKLRPGLMPPKQVDSSVPRGQLLMQVLKDLCLPAVLIISVLGSIIVGIATPTEAAAIGAIGATLLAVVSGAFSGKMLTSAVRDTTLTTAMIMFIAIGATAFSVIFKQIGGTHMIEDMVDSLSLGPYGTVLFVLVIIFFMGFFLEWIEISYIILPIFGPIVAGLDLGLGSGSQNLVWFAVLMAVNMQTSFLTPPLGFSLFYLKGIAPPGFGMADIYRGIVPFVLLQLVALILVFFYPALAIWLPAVMSN